MNQKFDTLKGLLLELFRLDQPDLDFGLYRVLRHKSAEIARFLEEDLLPQVKAALARDEVGELHLGRLEGEVYDHLYGFFRRYYAEGDFLARRVYKPGVYAIPYEGEEVALHWAHKDQYYIKTSEHLRDYAFALRPGADAPMRVHFRLIDAEDLEHGNVKPAEGKTRRFRLASEKAVALEEGELVVRFTYRCDLATQKDLNAAAEEAILTSSEPALRPWLAELARPNARPDGTSAGTRLGAHLDRYAARNTFDYFIHKDLGGFLRRELDFYIENEVMHLDDLENESAPQVEQYLSKIKIIRRIAGKIIALLAQLEDFQQKLWLKKKLVIETQYCVTLGCIPEAFYAELAANEAQQAEWESLLAFDLIQGDLMAPARGQRLTPERLKTYPTLVLDTRHFDADFVARLLDALGDVDDLTDGVLFFGENFQALSLMQARYREQVKGVYIDPPYNTGTDGFAYKDAYQHSTWLTMLESRIGLARRLLQSDGLFFSSIDDIEVHNLRRLLDDLFGMRHFVGTLSWISTTQPDNIGRARFGLQQNLEYLLLHAACPSIDLPPFSLRPGGAPRTYPHHGRFGACRFEIIERAFEGAYARPTMQFPIQGQLPRAGKQWQIGLETARALEAAGKLEVVDGILKRAVYPEDEAGGDTGRVPFWAHLTGVGTAQTGKAELTTLLGRGHGFDTVKPVSLLCRLLEHIPATGPLLDFFAGSGTTGHAVIALNRADGERRRFILVEMGDHFDTVLLPRLKKVIFTPEWKDGRPKRAATAEEALRGPRIVKRLRLESYEDTLDNLEPRRTTHQQLALDLAQAQGQDGFKEDYLLRYMLEVETRGSPSLLNVAAFKDPTAYTLKVRRPGGNERREVKVDLLETFNWLLGLTVQHIARPRSFSAVFVRDAEKRLRLEGRLQAWDSRSASAAYWFRTVTGTTPDGKRVLVIWRKLTGRPEEDDLVLDTWLLEQGDAAVGAFDRIYVNGANTVLNLRAAGAHWQVRRIEEDFLRLMFLAEGS